MDPMLEAMLATIISGQTTSLIAIRELVPQSDTKVQDLIMKTIEMNQIALKNLRGET